MRRDLQPTQQKVGDIGSVEHKTKQNYISLKKSHVYAHAYAPEPITRSPHRLARAERGRRVTEKQRADHTLWLKLLKSLLKLRLKYFERTRELSTNTGIASAHVPAALRDAIVVGDWHVRVIA